MKILIVDDQPTNRKLLRVTLKSAGYTAFEAEDGLAALEILNSQKIDAVVSDILMPRMDGYRLCYELRGRKELRNIPIVIYSATYISPSERKVALDFGADKFIRKPAAPEVIVQALRELGARKRSRPARRAPAKDLQVMKQYSAALVHKLEETNAELEQARQKITKANQELEQRVRERTAELEVTNRELEAFSHSVSHDLRAPLRHIHGFTQALVEDCSDRLDARGKEYLDRIRDSIDHMSQLIEDLLSLARVTRAEITREPVDLTALAAEIAEDLRRSDPKRQAVFMVGADLVADGDARLLRVMLQNLLGNAWKFTAKANPGRIEFGVAPYNGQATYYVRDNGVGFDMTYADKLFGAFQRLHSATEFEGTGIGLATVQRIVHRHGGRVWAEAEVGRGATFYFTL